jgi:hypothetical protein
MRTIKLISRFYGGIFLANFLVTMSCIYLFGVFGALTHKIAAMLFWYKLISLILIFYTSVHYRKQELYYYQNLGVSKGQLAAGTSVLDILITVLLLFLKLKFQVPNYIFNDLLYLLLIIHVYLYSRK